MGFNYNSAKLLLYTKSRGINFGMTLTIGRQGLHLDAQTLQKHFYEYGINNVDAAKILRADNGYAESFLKLLGASEVSSLDASDYESATVIHDMNTPIPQQFKNKYDVVIDGGSLEHIFNFPAAIKNCMEMIKPGGYFLGFTPANNFLGHGLYQFSPELYFRVFSKENGFAIDKIIFYNDQKNAGWYEVSDPDEVKSRVTMVNGKSSYLFVMAKKISDVAVFAVTPQQSDYQHILWETKNNPTPVKLNQRNNSLMAKVSSIVNRFLSFFSEIGNANTNYFKKIKYK